MTEQMVERLKAMTTRWPLQDIRDEVAAVLADTAEQDRPYVPKQLLRSLDMFLDSYGPRGWNAQNEN